MTDRRAAALEYLNFDHRASIVGYLHSQANKFELSDQRDAATALRATASSVAAEIDINAGQGGIASPIDAIILEVCAHFGGTNHAEVIGATPGSHAARRARLAAMWVAKRRLTSWHGTQFAEAFHRDGSTFGQASKRAEEVRATDHVFKRITDNLTEQEFRCENCQAPLLPAA